LRVVKDPSEVVESPVKLSPDREAVASVVAAVEEQGGVSD
jgi:hypothetical protein